MSRAARWLLVALVLAGAFAWQARWASVPTTAASPTSAGASATSPAANDAPQSASSAATAPGAPTDPAAEVVAEAEVAAAIASSEPRAPSAPALPTPTPQQAREWMLQRQRNQDCFIARSSYTQARLEREEWPWLAPERVAIEQAALAQARERLLQGCPEALVDPDQRKRQSEERQLQLEAARRAGDLLARLQPGGLRTPEDFQRARSALYDALLTGDPELIARIGRMLDYIQPQRMFEGEPKAPESFVWPLVACGLGMDCGPGSRALDLACLEGLGGCGSGHLSEAYRELLPPWQYDLAERRRAELVARIRRGEIAGLFDPPPRSPGP